jgi:hypothetical protein
MWREIAQEHENMGSKADGAEVKMAEEQKVIKWYSGKGGGKQ